MRRLTTFRDWDELFWRWVSGTRCQFGGDNLGVVVEEQNGQRTGDAPAPPMGRVGQVGRVRRAGRLRQDGRSAERGRTELGEQDCRAGAAGLFAADGGGWLDHF